MFCPRTLFGCWSRSRCRSRSRSYVTIVCAWLPCCRTLNIKSYLFANFTFECTASGGGSSDVSARVGATAEAKNYSHRQGDRTRALTQTHTGPKAVTKMAREKNREKEKRIISLPKLGVCFQWCHMFAALAGSRPASPGPAQAHCPARILPLFGTLFARQPWRHGSLKANPSSSGHTSTRTCLGQQLLLWTCL